MKRILFVLAAALVSGSALANLELAKQKNCMSCHSVDARLVGPAYKDVAKRYAGQKDAEDKLVLKVLKGGERNLGCDGHAAQYAGDRGGGPHFSQVGAQS